MVADYAGAREQVEAVGEPVCFVINNALDAALDYELGAFEAGGGGNVERGAL